MKSALITGASRGIGRGIALHLARCGWGLTVSARKRPGLQEVTEELLAAGSPQVMPLACDMADRERLPDLVRLHAESFTTMTALVLNAGVGSAGNVSDFELRRLDMAVDINFRAPFVLTQLSLPFLRAWAAENPTGAKVIALSSLTGVCSEPQLAAYGATKAALSSFVQTLNLEEGANGVLASALEPGYVDTDLAAWAKIPAETMIPVTDVVAVVAALLELGRTTMVPRVLMARADSGGHRA